MSPEDVPEFPFAREQEYQPAPLNAKLRHKGPLAKVKLYDGSEAWVVTKHKECCEALGSDKLSADRRAPGYPEIHPGGHKAKEATPTFVNMDDPDHAKQRAVLEPEFTPETVNRKWRPMMEETVDVLLDRFIEKGKKGQQPIDLMEEFAIPVPTQIIYKALGVPEEDVERLSKDSEVRNSTSRNAAETSNQELQKYMAKLVKDKMEHPGGDDIISRLVREQLKPGRLTENDVATLAFLVLTAGNAALINSIGLGVLTLLRHPDQLADFRRDPDGLAGRVVSELTRYNTASALNSRRAVKEDLDLDSQHLKKGEGVICLVQAANRDEDKFGPDAEAFNIRRRPELLRPEEILAFGYGPHRCQAEAFSRAQLEIVFAKLAKRVPNLRLARDPAELEYSPKTMNVGVVELPVYLK
ncbi:cytochrome P450 [Xylariomycetidae sp. FL2044]|nr:cytochrome P450 [Xylariomycetidae sp. FL2044]